MHKELFRLAYDVRMQQGSEDTAEVMLYGQIIENTPEVWKWSKEDKSAADFDKAIKAVREAGAKKLLLRINSPGGVCTESVAMRAILAAAGFDSVDIRIEGLCASAATVLATIPGAHVAICEGSSYMIHNPWCLAVGNANELENTIQQLRNIEEMSRGFYMRKTGQDETQIKAWMDAETWFTDRQAVAYGFADELLEAEAGSATPAAACVSSRAMAAMRDLYRDIPEQVVALDEAPEDTVSNEAPVAGAPTEIHHNEEEHPHMDIKDINMDQLREENPALLNQIQQSAVAAERQRQSDIDALTIPGYEAMAAQAKADGTSAIEFQKQLVSAMRQKGADFMAQRQSETAPAQQVAGGAPQDNQPSEEQLMKQNAEEIAAFAKAYSGSADGGMY